jgi:hypothetical protein
MPKLPSAMNKHVTPQIEASNLSLSSNKSQKLRQPSDKTKDSDAMWNLKPNMPPKKVEVKMTPLL